MGELGVRIRRERPDQANEVLELLRKLQGGGEQQRQQGGKIQQSAQIKTSALAGRVFTSCACSG